MHHDSLQIPRFLRALALLVLAGISLPLAAGQTIDASANPPPAGPQRLLVVHSYNMAMSWVRDIERGIEDTAAQIAPGTRIDIFAMDTKFHFSPAYLAELARLFRFKYSGERYDAIITADDAALHFTLGLRDAVLPGTPLAFCGVNSFSNEIIAARPGVTGVVEDLDIEPTIRTALRLHPKTKTLVVINDRSQTGIGNRQMLDRVLPGLARQVSIRIFDDLSFKDLAAAVSGLPEDTLILLLTYTTDANGATMDYQESIRLIRTAASVPVYGVWDFYLGHGIVGGMLTSGETHGALATRLALRLACGENAARLPVIRKSPNAFAFDAAELARFGVARASLPAGSRIINLPRDFISENSGIVIATVSFIVLLALIIALLLFAIRRRKSAEHGLRESENRYRNLSEELEQKVQERTAMLKAANEEMQQLLDELSKDALAGKRIQFQLLPEKQVSFGEYAFAHALHPSRYLSGDFLDYFEIDKDHIGFYTADVSGHGLPSAFVTVFLKSLIDQHLEKYRSGTSNLIANPARLLLHLNSEILRQQIDKHLTLFYAVIEISTNRLTFANGGQFPFPILYDAKGGSRYVEKNSPPVGLFGFANYANVTIELPQHFTLFIASDGILEVLGQDSLAGKEQTLLGLVGDKEITVAGLQTRLNLNERVNLPDDITMLIIKKE